MRKTKLRLLAAPAYSTEVEDRSPAGRAEIGCRVPATPVRLDIMSTLATGWLPWGVQWSPYLTRAGNEWILCCGHVLKFDHVSHFVTCGLLEECLDEAGQESLRITAAGREWLIANWRRKPRRMPEQPAPRPRRSFGNEKEQPF